MYFMVPMTMTTIQIHTTSIIITPPSSDMCPPQRKRPKNLIACDASSCFVFASTTAIQSSLSAGKKRALQRIWHRPLKTFAAAAELKISLIAVMLILMMMLIMIRLSFMKIAKLQPCPSGLVVWLVSWVCNGSRHRAPFYIK